MSMREADNPSMAKRPFQISAWGVNPRRQALSSALLTGSRLEAVSLPEFVAMLTEVYMKFTQG